MTIDVAALYRIGPGPSSSRTVGPMLAARRFVHELAAEGRLAATAGVRVELFGGLACTGREAGSHLGVVAGLSGLRPEACDAPALARCAARAGNTGRVALGGGRPIAFAPARDVAFCVDRTLAYDGNALRFVASDAQGNALASALYFSTGGGEVVAERELGAAPFRPRVPYAYDSVARILELGRTHRKKLADMALANACVVRSPNEVKIALLGAAQAMFASIERGLAAAGPMPGGAPRTAATRAAALVAAGSPSAAWCPAYATAVAEENACGGVVVAAPSSGAAGPVAALLRHYAESDPMAGDVGAAEFLMAAAAIGAYLRERGLKQAGCQGEVGVAAAMAAGGLTAVRRGTNEQVLYAAELALEPHHGLACDSIGARVQQPCIERNANAAARALAAAQDALRQPMPRSRLDALVEAMVERGRGMAGRYKEASLGGVAVSVADC